MRFRLITITFITSIIITLTACKNLDKNTNYLTISDIKGQQISKIDDQKILSILLTEWHKKEKIILKKMPEFDAELLMMENGNSSMWQYSRYVYLMALDQKDKNIYRVELKAVNQVLNKSSK